MSRHFLRLAQTLDPAPLLLQLYQHRDLWNQNPGRTQAEDSPHRECDDIWLRYQDPRELLTERAHEPHWPVWYDASNKLSVARLIAQQVMHMCSAEHLGGILVSRIPAGARVYAHNDTNWHALHYNCKVYAVLQSNDHCLNRAEDEVVTMRAGEIWTFDNRLDHEVVNSGGEDRITLIICMRKDG